MYRFLLLIALLVVTLHPALAAPAPKILIPSVPPLAVTYDVYVGGIHLMTADVVFQEQAAGYRVRVLGHTYGLWYKLIPWNTELKVEGTIREDRFVPAEFYTRDVWWHKPRTTWLHFKEDGDIKPDFDPPNNDKNREAISLEQRRGSLDPISGLLQLLAHVTVHKSCAVTVPIFEGRRRFDITGIDAGTETIDDSDYSSFSGEARACDAQFNMVAGEWKDRPPDRFWVRNSGETGREPFHIWLGSLAPGLPEMPVRLESGSVWGLIIMHLSSWHYATPEELNY